jgi:hypothetical protein
MNNLSVVILAAGEQKRWAPAGCKQLVDIKGVPLIQRTVELARAVWAVEPWIIVRPDNPAPFGFDYRYILANNHRHIFDTLESIKGLWRKETVVLLGDTFYSAAAMQLLRDGKDIFYGDPGEIYALKLRPRDWRKMRDAITMARAAGGSKLWHVYRMMQGYPLEDNRIGADFYRIENGQDGVVMWDFDRVDKYEKFNREYLQYA